MRFKRILNLRMLFILKILSTSFIHLSFHQHDFITCRDSHLQENSPRNRNHPRDMFCHHQRHQHPPNGNVHVPMGSSADMGVHDRSYGQSCVPHVKPDELVLPPNGGKRIEYRILASNKHFGNHDLHVRKRFEPKLTFGVVQTRAIRLDCIRPPKRVNR